MDISALMNRGGFFFGGSADLADHHHGLCFGIVLERLEAIDERRAGNRIAADADTRRDADALLLQLVQRLVRQGARSTDDANRPAFAMWPAVIPMLHFPGLMIPGQFGPSRRTFG